ncbi:MAG: hypothetical protein KAI66_25430 [Lentisphaeria bacterium]|nr:hypothetical protein [Lentisphaeria bacterium]
MRVMILFVMVLLPSYSYSLDAGKPSRIAVINLAPDSEGVAGLIDLLEVELASKDDVEVVEREQIALILKEQALQSLGSGGDRATTLRMGAILRAHLLVLFSASTEKDGDRVRLSILETRRGVRLFDEIFPVVISDLSPYVAATIDTLGKALRHEKQDYYAIAPLTSRELSFRYDHYQNSVAAAVRLELLRQGKPVLEFEEARRLLDEYGLSRGEAHADFPNLTTVKGTFSVAHTKPEVLNLDLELATIDGRRKHLRAQIPADGQTIEESIRRLVARILASSLSPKPHSDSQTQHRTVKWLTECGRLHSRIGAWDQARQEFEAALLAEPSSRILRNELILIYGELLKGVPYRTLPLAREQKQLLTLHRRGLDQVEWIVRNTRQLSDKEVIRITGFLQPRWWWRVTVHARQRKQSLRELDPSLQDMVSEHMGQIRAVSRRILQDHDGKCFRRHSRMTGAWQWYLGTESWIRESENEKYQLRLKLLEAVGAKATKHSRWQDALKPIKGSQAMRGTPYWQYLLSVLRQKNCPSVKLEATAMLEKMRVSDKPPTRRPRKNKKKTPGHYPDSFSIAEVHLVDSSTGDPFLPKNVTQIIRCGQYGDAICLQRQVFFLASSKKATSILQWPKDDYSVINDVRWDGKFLWLAISSFTHSTGRNIVCCWNPENGAMKEWGAAQGIPMEALAIRTQGAANRMGLCPFGGRVFVVGSQRISAIASRTWIGSIAPASDRVEILFKARSISDRTRDWETHISDISRGFFAGSAGVYQTGVKKIDSRLLISRDTGWGQAYPLALDPATGQVSVQKVPPPFLNASTMRFCDGRIAWRSAGTFYWSSASTFQILHSIKDLGHIRSWFEYEGSVLAYGHSILWVDDRNMTVTEIVPNVLELLPLITLMAPSKHFGILGFNYRKQAFYAVSIDKNTQLAEPMRQE